MSEHSPPFSFRPAVLVVDADQAASRALLEDPAAKLTPVHSASSGWQAQALLADQDLLLCGVFLSPSVSNPGWHSVAKAVAMHRPALPVFLLLCEDGSDDPGLSEIELHRAGIKQVLRKPLELRRAIELSDPMSLSFDFRAALESAKQSSARAGDEIGKETHALDAEFVPIRASGFLAGSRSFFDLYIRLGAGKYVKLLQAGDSFTQERIEGYLKKGVVNLYLRRDAHEAYLSYAAALASALLKSSTVPTAADSQAARIQLRQTLVHGEETLKFLESQGVTGANIRYGARFVRNAHELVAQLDFAAEDWLKSFLAQVALHDHASGTVVLAAILAQELEMRMERPMQLIGLAALFHHLGLSKLPEKLWDEDESVMSPEEIARYREHPLASVELLRDRSGIDPASLQAIEQHHMRPGGKGFPVRAVPGPLHAIGQMIGICSEFNHQIKAGKDSAAILEVLEERTFPCFSRQIVYGFRGAFYPRF